MTRHEIILEVLCDTFGRNGFAGEVAGTIDEDWDQLKREAYQKDEEFLDAMERAVWLYYAPGTGSARSAAYHIIRKVSEAG